MVRPEIVRRKLSHLHDYLSELERHRNVTLEEYLEPDGPRRAVERLLQLVVERAVDINVHTVTELGQAPPPDYKSSFLQAANHGVIPGDLASKLAPSAGLRNVLGHEYGEIEDALVHESIVPALEDFAGYSRAVEQWLERYESEPLHSD